MIFSSSPSGSSTIDSISARQLAEQAPRGELRRYACTHFDFYREGVRAQVIRDQIDFLLISFGPHRR